MKQAFYAIVLLLSILNNTLWAQKAVISGTVSDHVEPLLGVTIKVIGSSEGTTTDLDGKYSLELDPGTHTIEFSYIGSAKTTTRVDLKAGETRQLDITLAEETTVLGKVTVSSSKFEKPLGEVTVSLDVISSDFIENTNSTQVNDALEKVPGVNTMGNQVTIRGGSGFAQGTGSRVLLLLDDMPAMQADAGLPNWADLPTENIAQMEVLKGAASALYGSTALSGVINIRSAYPTDKPLTKVSLWGTLYDSPKNKANKWWTASDMPYKTGLQFSHRRKIKKFDIVGGMNMYDNRSYVRGYETFNKSAFQPIADSIAREGRSGYDQKGRLTLNGRYRHSEKLIFALNTNINFGKQATYLFWAQDKVNDKYEQLHGRRLGLYETSGAPAPEGNYFRMTVDPSVTFYDKAEGRHRLQLRYYLIRNDNLNGQGNNSNQFFGEYQYQRRFEKLQDLEVAAGLVGSTLKSQAEIYSNAEYRNSNFASYLQLDKKLFDRLNISLGVRYELNAGNYPDSLTTLYYGNEITQNIDNIVEHRPVFRAGMNYQVGAATYLRTSWGQGYRFPTILEKFISTFNGGIFIVPNTQLQSETGWSSEIAVKQGFKIKDWQGFLDIAGFWSEYDNMMEFQYTNSTTFPLAFQVANIGNTRIYGFDVNLMGTGQIGEVDLSLLAGYTFLKPMFRDFDQDSTTRERIQRSSTSDENVLKYRFNHTAKIDAQATYKGLTAGFTFQYISGIKAIDSYLNNAQAYPSILNFLEENPGAKILNARLAYQVTKFAKISLLAQNVLNREYTLQPGILEAPRNFTLRADFTF